MKVLNKTKMAVLASLVALAAAAQSPIDVRWEMGVNGAEKGYYSSRFVIKNVSGKQLGGNWQFYFNQFSRSFKLPDNCPVTMKEVSTTYYQVTPGANYKPMADGDSIVIDMLMRGSFVNYCYWPNGGHVVMDGNTTNPIPAPIKHAELAKHGQWSEHALYPDGNYSYAYNEAINGIGDAYTGNDYDIFPTPKTVELKNGVTKVGSLVTVKGGGLFKKVPALDYLKSELKSRGIYAASKQATQISVKVSGGINSNPEYYTLDVNEGKIAIVGASNEGALNGVKTLLAALDHSKGHNLQNAHIADFPDLHYRGYMLDISRNYFGYDNILRFIDLMAYYKLNRLQFHFSDDESWRVEIPGLPELTEVASRRGCTLDEKGYLAQIFDGNGNPNDLSTSANGYLTRKQFINMLRYAAARGVKVIPEVETPGHARAAIVAMKNRYDKYVATDPAKAEQYKIWEPENTSVYTSAQSYHDNVVNVAGDGLYNFVDKVVAELELMYKEAGLKLDIVHLGGDEVPRGSWDKSPAVQALMQREGLKNAHEVNEYYISRMSDILYKRGILIEGWQEVALDHKPEWNQKMTKRFAGVNAWSTVGSRDVVPYNLANDGYPVILSNVTNFYMDMGYTWHQYDQGLHWGGKVDEIDSWSGLPWDVYASARTSYEGKPIDVTRSGEGKPALQNKANIIGVQAQLWGETIRNFDQVQYMTLPKVFGVVERGWNPVPEWSKDLSDVKAYEVARRQYNQKVGAIELPIMMKKGYNFRVGMPGLKVVDGKLVANSQYPGMVIRYTLDGSEPTHESAVWTAPVAVGSYDVIKAKAYYLGKESLTTYLFK